MWLRTFIFVSLVIAIAELSLSLSNPISRFYAWMTPAAAGVTILLNVLSLCLWKDIVEMNVWMMANRVLPNLTIDQSGISPQRLLFLGLIRFAGFLLYIWWPGAGAFILLMRDEEIHGKKPSRSITVRCIVEAAFAFLNLVVWMVVFGLFGGYDNRLPMRVAPVRNQDNTRSDTMRPVNNTYPLANPVHAPIPVNRNPVNPHFANPSSMAR
ncbi:hypothetical protein FRC19_006161 [Serendipita sp. 401]|nr:hypothetical protein FRC15_005884 [Serendipita sp. 397]KAG8808040.1 hypothetical protein FRC19_006161 [Serendipita sp. 401]KAG8839046.1 hypothetical protein FRC20_006168 [Serendipita sp. 405]KAG9036709.1 hypothetical protein FS842_003415 [Serendipita sp. 407]